MKGSGVWRTPRFVEHGALVGASAPLSRERGSERGGRGVRPALDARPARRVGVLLFAHIIGQLGSLIPIPRGIGGVDAGLIGTLVLYGVDATDAAVAVFACRGLLLAIPALLGPPALAVLRRRLRDEAHDIAACAPGQAVEVLGRGVVRQGVPAARPAT